MASPVSGAPLEFETAKILSGAQVSNAITVGGRCIVGIDTGATLTSTALGLKHSTDGATFRTVYDTSGNALSWTTAGARYLKFDPPLLGYQFIQITSGSAEGADRTLTVVFAP